MVQIKQLQRLRQNVALKLGGASKYSVFADKSTATVSYIENNGPTNLKFGLSHRKELSPLTQGLNYTVHPVISRNCFHFTCCLPSHSALSRCHVQQEKCLRQNLGGKRGTSTPTHIRSTSTSIAAAYPAKFRKCILTGGIDIFS